LTSRKSKYGGRDEAFSVAVVCDVAQVAGRTPREITSILTMILIFVVVCFINDDLYDIISRRCIKSIGSRKRQKQGKRRGFSSDDKGIWKGIGKNVY